MQRIKLLVIFVFALVFVAFKFSSSPTVSGQTSLTAPTGITASDGSYSTKIGIRWDTIRNATSYRIFRNTTNNPGTAVEIGTTPSNNFFDAGTAQGQTVFYWVRAENATTTSSLSQSDQGLRAVGTVNQNNPPLEPPPTPPANPTTATKIYLGKALFWDEQLSSTRTVSCGTCHQPDKGGSDPRSLVNNSLTTNPGFDSIFGTADDVFASPGVPMTNADGTYIFSSSYGLKEQVTGRKTNSYINAGYSPTLFWDGRATPTFRDPLTNAVVINNGGALESQVIGPPVSSSEMAHSGRNWTDVANRVTASKPLALAPTMPTALQTWIGGRSYPELFLEAFGTSDVTPTRIALAIGTYERTLYSDQTPFDADAGGITLLTPQENRGRGVFNGTQCNVCHAGNLFTNQAFINIGIRPTNEDTGRFQVTGNPQNLGEFKVPSLRNVELRGPYMHNGRFATLEDVVEFYNRGGDFPNAPNFPANLIRPRGLSVQQKADLVAFLKRPLTDPRVTAESSLFDRPQLYTESNRVPVITGTGTAGSSALVPTAIAVEPPLVGNPSFTVAVANALGAANAVLVINSTDPGNTSNIPSSGSFARVALQTQGTGAGNGYASVSLPIPDNAALVGQTFFGRWYITDAGAAGGIAVSQAFRFTVFGTATAVLHAAHADFDGDQKTDISIWRPSNGQWWYSKSSDGQTSALQFGAGTDKIVPADFSGDGKTDIAVWRSSTSEWFILRSEDNSFYSIPFGTAGDIPAPGDFDADGKADIAVFRPSTATWFIQGSTQGTVIQQFGANGDIPQVGDYDGDAKTDIAIFRPSNGQWWINRSASGVIATTFGIGTDKPVAQDFTGDGKTDIAFYRPSSGEWFVLRSEDSSYFSAPFGISTDIPAPGDYDGDGRSDFAVFRSGTWYVNRSTQGILIASFGSTGDIPAPAAFVP